VEHLTQDKVHSLQDAGFVIVEKVALNPQQLFTHLNFKFGMHTMKRLNFNAHLIN
jgi:hypothetical protein